MKWLTFEIQRSPGFRFNLTDLGLILFLLGVSSAIFLVEPDRSFWLVPLYLGLSFFLFCNVFRIGNRLEPLWYVPFTAAALWGMYVEDLRAFWLMVLFGLEPLKWVLVGYWMWKGPYVGVMHDRLKSSKAE